ncbi:MAG: glycosyltransferase family 4 protein [Paraglaciecola sp.]|nr:glycosyltransferase family 4 protein [Paraglaciecola sp.]
MHLTYDMRIGGTEMVIKNIVEGCDTTKFTMSIFCIEKPLGPWGIELQESGLAIDGCERQPGFDRSLIEAIRKHLKKSDIDIIHCHQYTPWVYGVLAAVGLKTKVVFTEHGRFYPDSSSWKRKLLNPWLCRITDRITAISQATKQALVDFENIPEKRIDVIYNGIKPPRVVPRKTLELKEKLRLSSETKIIGTIARLDPIKNHHMMLNAFAQVLITHPNITLLVVGDGEERINIEKQINSLGIKDNVIMTGYDPQPQHYLDLMDIFLLPSFSEGTSMTLLEAMALGKPCIVTDVGGNPEVIKHHNNGLVVKTNDAEALSEAIKQLISDSKTAEKMGFVGQKRYASTFSDSVMNTTFSNLYTNLLPSHS